jgi:hypothetical protein
MAKENEQLLKLAILEGARAIHAERTSILPSSSADLSVRIVASGDDWVAAVDDGAMVSEFKIAGHPADTTERAMRNLATAVARELDSVVAKLKERVRDGEETARRIKEYLK